jgi:DNA invertase Pin-like site-specific DNA recombinase
VNRAVLYMRVSSLDQHPETQLFDLRQMAAQRGYEIVHEYTDRISGAKARRPGLDELMRDARRGRFDVVLLALLSSAPATQLASRHRDRRVTLR